MATAWRTCRYAVEYALFRLVGAFYGALPIEPASALSGWLWRHVAPRLSRHKRALAHLRTAFPEKTEAECDAIARGMWENLGRVFAEAFHLQEIARGDRIVIEPIEAMRALSASGKATVICAPHLGNWELTIMGLVRPGLKPASIYQKIKNPFVDAYVSRLRKPHYPGGLLPKTPETPRRLMRYARDGGTVAFLADLRDHKGLKVPFFGRPAPSTVFPALVARTFAAPLYAAHLVREPGVRFRFFIEQVPLAKTEDREADIAAATAAMQAAFERFIRAAPEQWMWAHRRWG
jgi:KDO2-lipid IV(A) lauroyltransferase